MNLELKHIAPYLPYGITFDHFDDEREIKSICEFSSLNVDEITITNSHHEYTYSIGEVKPILRPISDLMKDDFLLKKDQINELLEPSGLAINEVYSFLLYNAIANVAVSFQELSNILNLLLEQRFDLFGLLPAGLAIDINTLEGGVNHEA